MLQLQAFTIQSHRFENVESFAESFDDWQLEIHQLAAKLFVGKVTRFDFGKLSVFRVSIHCQVEILSEAPKDALLFLIPMKINGQKYHRHFDHAIPIERNCFLGLDCDRSMNLVSASKGIEFVALKIPKDHFLRLANQVDGFSCQPIFLKQNVICVDETQVNTYREYLTQILGIVQENVDSFASAIKVTPLADTIIFKLLRMLQLSATPKTPRPLRRADIVELAREYMNTHIHRPITLADVSQAVCVSRRSLIYAFQDIYGMGPITYLKCQRLNRARKELRSEQSVNRTVADIAHVCGIWSLGHFARSYRLMFGETPSETLKSHLKE